MLITNHTRQIFIASETMVGITLSYVADDLTKFFVKGEQAPGDERPKAVELTVVGQNGLLRFTERYGSMAKATEAMDACLCAISGKRQVYTFPLDEEYEEFLRAERERKKKQAEQQRPAYQQEDNPNGQN